MERMCLSFLASHAHIYGGVRSTLPTVLRWLVYENKK